MTTGENEETKGGATFSLKDLLEGTNSDELENRRASQIEEQFRKNPLEPGSAEWFQRNQMLLSRALAKFESAERRFRWAEKQIVALKEEIDRLKGGT